MLLAVERDPNTTFARKSSTMFISRKFAFAALFTFSTLTTCLNFAEAGGCGGSRSSGGYSSHISRSYGRSYGHSYGNVSHGYSYNVQPVVRHVSSQPIVRTQIQSIRPVQSILGQPVTRSQAPVSQPLQPSLQPSLQPRQLTSAQPQTVPSEPLRPVANSAQPSAISPAAPTQRTVTPQQSALRALGAFAPAAPTNTATPAHFVGSWKASVGNGAAVSLTLSANGQFEWTATNNGADSRFSGRYSVENGNLNLTRSNDNVQLIGAMKQTANGFSFKVNGTNAAAITFSRS